MSKVLFRSLFLTPLFLVSALAAPVDQLVVFGDSLSDTGNAAIAAGPAFPANYWNGRLTDGPTTTPASNGPIGNWVDQLSGKLGVADPQPFLAGGTDFAVATALTGSNGTFDISDQVATYTFTHPGGASSTALYTIWGGANDLFSGNHSPVTAADNLFANIQNLAAAGGKNFLWLNLPPLGLTPLGLRDSQTSAALNAGAVLFNNEWASDIAKLQGQGINVIGVDIYNAFQQVEANPGAYGISNLTMPAQGMAGVDPNTFLFWDEQHPTTVGHGVVANAAFQDLTPSPEPASLLFTALGLGGLAVGARQRARFRTRK